METIENKILLYKISRLTQIRLDYNLTRKDVAKIAHTTPEIILMMEHGVCTCEAEVRRIIDRLENSIFMMKVV